MRESASGGCTSTASSRPTNEQTDPLLVPARYPRLLLRFLTGQERSILATGVLEALNRELETRLELVEINALVPVPSILNP